MVEKRTRGTMIRSYLGKKKNPNSFMLLAALLGYVILMSTSNVILGFWHIPSWDNVLVTVFIPIRRAVVYDQGDTHSRCPNLLASLVVG